MTTYAWPDFGVNRFEMRVQPNFRSFPNPFTGTAQIVNLGGERWIVSVGLVPGNKLKRAGEQEAFFDRLYGPVNRVSLWNLRRPVPLGTLQDGGGNAQWKTNTNANATWQTSAPAAATWSYGGPTLMAAVALQSNVLPIARTPGTTVETGDMVGVGGQLFRAMAAAVADSTGLIQLEVSPRPRTAFALGAAVTCTKPTANFILKSDGVPVGWQPGNYASTSFDLVEAP
jgi:hypothetical protein